MGLGSVMPARTLQPSVRRCILALHLVSPACAMGLRMMVVRPSLTVDTGGGPGLSRVSKAAAAISDAIGKPFTQLVLMQQIVRSKYQQAQPGLLQAAI